MFCSSANSLLEDAELPEPEPLVGNNFLAIRDVSSRLLPFADDVPPAEEALPTALVAVVTDAVAAAGAGDVAVVAADAVSNWIADVTI